jgi:gluconolactonase
MIRRSRLFSKVLSLLVLGGVISAAPVFAAEKLDTPTGKQVVSPESKLEHLFTRQIKAEGGLTEGPAVAKDGSIYFSDILREKTKGMILRFDPKTKKTTVFAADSHKSNGLIFNAEGELLACEGADYGGRGYSKWNVKSGKRTVIAATYQGKKFNAPNDICLDRQGRMYVTDPRYLGHETRELKHRAVYRIDRDGTVLEITHNVSKPNGIAISPNGKTLYVADHDNGTDAIDPDKPAPKLGPMKIYAFPLGKDGLVNGARKTIVDFGSQPGCDGMTVDSKGRIYLTSRSPKRPGVLVINPKGKEVAFIPTGPKNQMPDKTHPPIGLPSNVEFGIGKEIRVLYITVGISLYRIRLKSKGFHPQYLKR